MALRAHTRPVAHITDPRILGELLRIHSGSSVLPTPAVAKSAVPVVQIESLDINPHVEVLRHSAVTCWKCSTTLPWGSSSFCVTSC
jgi:hypothetical protein